LTDEQWASPSLCDGWSVRDTVVHVAWHIHREPKEAAGFLLRGALFGSARVTAQQIARDGARSKDSLLEWFASPGQCNKVYLGELMIHQQDIRRPLGLDRKIADDRLTRILDLCLTRSGSLSLIPGSRKLAHGLHLVAIDSDWSAGNGAETRGPSEAILMSINGRGGAIDELAGPGAGILADRLAAKHGTGRRR
jgi:uncharacterized protein (TIGR03083 family)